MAHTDTCARGSSVCIARRQHFHITLEDHSTKSTLNCGITRLADSASPACFWSYTSQDWFADNGLPATSLQCIDAAPVIRERQIDGRFREHGCFRHVVSGVNKVHCLTVNTRIKRTNIILVVVNVLTAALPSSYWCSASLKTELLG